MHICTPSPPSRMCRRDARQAVRAQQGLRLSSAHRAERIAAAAGAVEVNVCARSGDPRGQVPAAGCDLRDRVPVTRVAQAGDRPRQATCKASMQDREEPSSSASTVFACLTKPALCGRRTAQQTPCHMKSGAGSCQPGTTVDAARLNLPSDVNRHQKWWNALDTGTDLSQHPGKYRRHNAAHSWVVVPVYCRPQTKPALEQATTSSLAAIQHSC